MKFQLKVAVLIEAIYWRKMRALIVFCLIAGIYADCDFTTTEIKNKYDYFVQHAFEWDMDHFKTELHKLKDYTVDFKEKFDGACFDTDDGRAFMVKYNKFMIKIDFWDSFDFDQMKSKFCLNPFSVFCLDLIFWAAVLPYF